MIFWEIKLLLLDYKKIFIFFLVFFVLTISSFYLLKIMEYRGYLFEPFTVGVVNNDDFEELDKIFSLYNSTEKMSSVINFQLMEQNIANEKIISGDIPAYIIVPENFSHNVIVGKNQPVVIVGNENMWLQVNVVKMIVNIGISFLTTSQSGIYSTIDYSYDLGLTSQTIDEKIVMPINLQYAIALLGYGKFFQSELINPTGNVSFIEYYGMSLYIFLITLVSIGFLPTLNKSCNKNILIMYKPSPKPFYYYLLLKILSFSTVLGLISLPIVYFIGWSYIIILLLVSSFVFFINSISNNVIVNSIILLFVAFISAFVSGGIVPMVMLPNIFNIINKVTVNYYLLNLNSWVDYFNCLILFAVYTGLSYLLLMRRREI